MRLMVKFVYCRFLSKANLLETFICGNDWDCEFCDDAVSSVCGTGTRAAVLVLGPGPGPAWSWTGTNVRRRTS